MSVSINLKRGRSIRQKRFKVEEIFRILRECEGGLSGIFEKLPLAKTEDDLKALLPYNLKPENLIYPNPLE